MSRGWCGPDRHTQGENLLHATGNTQTHFTLSEQLLLCQPAGVIYSNVCKVSETEEKNIQNFS